MYALFLAFISSSLHAFLRVTSCASLEARFICSAFLTLLVKPLKLLPGSWLLEGYALLLSTCAVTVSYLVCCFEPAA